VRNAVGECIKDSIYDSQAIRGFVGINPTHESAPHATAFIARTSGQSLTARLKSTARRWIPKPMQMR
jgi:hypothetical protein